MSTMSPASSGPGVVLALTTDDRADANFPGLAENLDVLRAATDARGRALEVLTIPQPRPRQRHDGRRLPLSHLSCYLANGAVIVPGFGDAADRAAAKAHRGGLGRAGDRAGRRAGGSSQGGGGLHGITLGQPAA